MKVAMLLKYDIVDKEKIQAKMDKIKQEPKRWVHTYHDKMEKFFTKKNWKMLNIGGGSYLGYTLKSKSCVS
jgi:N12 class adenine-specific DNA methylase